MKFLSIIFFVFLGTGVQAKTRALALHEMFEIRDTKGNLLAPRPAAWNDVIHADAAFTIDRSTNSVSGTLNFDVMVGTQANSNCEILANPVQVSYTKVLPGSGDVVLRPYAAAIKSIVTSTEPANTFNNGEDCIKYTVTNNPATSGHMAHIQGYHIIGNNGSAYNSVSDATTAWSTKQFILDGADGYTSSTSQGTNHSCALLNGEGVKCWGDNSQGQLGDSNSPTDSALPVFVRNTADNGSLAGVTSVHAGGNHTCAIVGGALFCWGDDSQAQLGDSAAKADKEIPTAVLSLTSGVTDACGGLLHTCAIKSGDVWCWGYNFYGNVGNGTTTTPITTPVDISLGSATALACGQAHTCALLSDGTVKCWGDNGYGQLGDGNDPTDSTSPTFVRNVADDGNLSSITAISAGLHHTCAMDSSGAAYCWGRDGWGMLGDDASLADKDLPVAVSGLGSGVTAIAAGGNHSCALVTNQLKCWGRNDKGQLGDDTTDNAPTHVNPLGLTANVLALPDSLGTKSTCVSLVGSTVVCKGYNASGQLGDGNSTTDKSKYVVAATLE